MNMCVYTVCLCVDTVERCFNVLPGMLKFKGVFFFFCCAEVKGLIAKTKMSLTFRMNKLRMEG